MNQFDVSDYAYASGGIQPYHKMLKENKTTQNFKVNSRNIFSEASKAGMQSFQDNDKKLSISFDKINNERRKSTLATGKLFTNRPQGNNTLRKA
jgi:hypothetical protein